MIAGKRNEERRGECAVKNSRHTYVHDFDERCEERDAWSVVEICKICFDVGRSFDFNQRSNWSRPDRRNTTVAISLGNEICYRATSCSASPNSARIARIARRTERTMMAMRTAAMMPAA